MAKPVTMRPTQRPFTAMKICNLPTTVVSQRGEWQMFLSHRFGSVNDGFKTFYGLDNANTCL